MGAALSTWPRTAMRQRQMQQGKWQACMGAALLIMAVPAASVDAPFGIVTPKGMLLPAKCHASATCEGLRASSREHFPSQK